MSTKTYSKYFTIDSNCGRRTNATHHYTEKLFDYSLHNLTPRVWTNAENKTLLREAISYESANKPIDWEKVALSVNKKLSPMECFMQYRNGIDPSINKSDWTPEESTKLLKLVEKYDEHYWSEVAAELGTNRTPFDCLRHYQRNLNDNIALSEDFTPEEDQILKEAVDEYGTGNWQLISSFLPGRSSRQVNARWRISSTCQETMVSGKWLEEEEKLLYLACIAYEVPFASQSKKTPQELEQLLSGEVVSDDIKPIVKKEKQRVSGKKTRTTKSFQVDNSQSSSNIGNNSSSSNDQSGSLEDSVPTTENIDDNAQGHSRADHVAADGTVTGGVEGSEGTNVVFRGWSDVAEMVPGKTDVQCREKWMGNLDPTINNAPFDQTEDELLLRLVDKIGEGLWVKVASYMPGRTKGHVRNRFLSLNRAPPVKMEKIVFGKRKRK